MTNKYFIFISILFLLSCQSDDHNLKSDTTINIQTSADGLTLFGEGVISTSLYERDLAIAPNGNQIIYTLADYKQNRRCLVVLNKKNGTWTKPEIMSISDSSSSSTLLIADNFLYKSFILSDSCILNTIP